MISNQISEKFCYYFINFSFVLERINWYDFLRVVGREDANMFNSNGGELTFLFLLLKSVISLVLPISSFLLSAYSLWRSGRWRREEKRAQLESYLFKYLRILAKDGEKGEEEFLNRLTEIGRASCRERV